MFPQVAWVEQDSEVQVQSQSEIIAQNHAPWGLARISQREKLHEQDGNTFWYSEEAGRGVHIYVIDTGININHTDFDGRAYVGTTIIPNEDDEDNNGHGTHCSGVIVGKQFGVAKKAGIYSVKTLSSNGRGKNSDVIKALEWLVNDHKKNLEASRNSKSQEQFKGSVVNISIGGPRSLASNMAVDAVVDAGIHVAVAAGNDNGDACNHSPSGSQMAITVGASTISDERAWFSNHGKCTNVFAPGFEIPGPWIGSNTDFRTTSGTSSASPHVAGLLAYFLSLQPSRSSAYAVTLVTPRALKELVIGVATKNALANVPDGTSNVLHP
jgi:cerevisin